MSRSKEAELIGARGEEEEGAGADMAEVRAVSAAWVGERCGKEGRWGAGMRDILRRY